VGFEDGLDLFCLLHKFHRPFR